jgi:energy-coupling factor transporter ATP-binding protein EcfA2
VGSHDVTIEQASVPEHLVNPSGSGEDWEMNKDSFLIRIPDVGRFLVQNGSSISVDPAMGHDPGELALYTLGTCFATLLQQRGAIVLHASAIAVGPKAVLFCGPSGAGKSTMAAMLCQYGYPLLNDDVCTLTHTEAQGYRVLSDTRKLKLWGSALEGLSLPESGLPAVSGKIDKYFVAPAHAETRSARPIGAIYVLEDAEPGEPVIIARLNPLEATVQLKINAYRPALVTVMNQQEIYFRASLAFQQSAGVFRLRRRRDFQQAEELLMHLQEHWREIGLDNSLAGAQERPLNEVMTA